MSDISMDEQVELKFVDDSDTSYEEKENWMILKIHLRLREKRNGCQILII